MTINEYCQEILQVLESVQEEQWIHTFKKIIKELEISNDNSVSRQILSIYGGMGSFSDLVLYKDGVVCISENNVLDNLRNGLYNQIALEWK